ncbi:hypothetical protein GA0115251_126623 [Streptomyces sp. TverLS-915]|nr:hypothetical protein GA0115251_126623 [Streptomyces sp. TverLS-915]
MRLPVHSTPEARVEPCQFQLCRGAKQLALLAFTEREEVSVHGELSCASLALRPLRLPAKG